MSAGMNTVKARMKSVQSTMQITKAMELVASSKLRKAKEKVEATRPYHDALHDAVGTICAACEAADSSFLFGSKNKSLPSLYVVIAGDRGLAGGYNSNVFRHTRAIADENALYLPIGKKALEYYKYRNLPVFSDRFTYVSDMGVGESLELAGEITKGFTDGVFGRVVLVYTRFTSMLSQNATSETLLPFSRKDFNKNSPNDLIIESEPEEMLLKIVPQYIGGIIYSAVCEALASESGSRRSAMNSANKNAEEIISSLTLKYNRARQAQITQEITEIVSGAEALQ